MLGEHLRDYESYRFAAGAWVEALFAQTIVYGHQITEPMFAARYPTVYKALRWLPKTEARTTKTACSIGSPRHWNALKRSDPPRKVFRRAGCDQGSKR